MHLPSLKTLEAAFPGKGKELRELLENTRLPSSYPAVKEWVDRCYHRPSYTEQLMCALNEVLEGHGTEPIWGGPIMRPIAEYVNMGDTYTTTILYDYDRGTINVTTMGDWVEHNERRVRQ